MTDRTRSRTRSTGGAAAGPAQAAGRFVGRHRAALILGAVVVTAAAVRLAFLTAEPLPAEAGGTLYHSAALERTVTDVNHPPLYYVVMWAWRLVVTPTVATLRLPSVLFGVALAAVVYLLVRRTAPPAWAGVAGMLVALSPLHLKMSQYERMYALLALLITLATYLLLTRDRSRLHRYGYFVVAGLAMATHIFAVAVVFLQLLDVWRREGTRALARLAAVLVPIAVASSGWVVVRAFSFASSSPWWMTIPRPGEWPALATTLAGLTQGHTWSGASAGTLIGVPGWLLLAVAATAVAGFLLAAVAAADRSGGLVALGAATALLLPLAVAVTYLFTPVVNERQFAFLTPFVAAMVAVGAQRAWAGARRRWLRGVVIAALGVVFPVQFAGILAEYDRPYDSRPWDCVGRAAAAAPGDVVYVASGTDYVEDVIGFYAGKPVVRVHDYPGSTYPDRDTHPPTILRDEPRFTIALAQLYSSEVFDRMQIPFRHIARVESCGAAYKTYVIERSGGQPVLPGAAPPPGLPRLGLRLVADGLDRPTHLTTPSGDDRLFVLEQFTGRIRIVADGVVQEEPFLDLEDRIFAAAPGAMEGLIERGLLGLAFHPDYRRNGRFFVYYADAAGAAELVEYRVSDDRADPDSATSLLRLEERIQHYGGGLAFAPDGALWLSVGDGGNPLDAPDPGSRRGGILRLDVSVPGRLAPAAGNPFAAGGGAPELWAIGLRNPWRWTIDPVSGLLYVADVGRDLAEEVSIAPFRSPGLDYGWPLFEGSTCRRAAGCGGGATVPPAFEYGHEGMGCAVVGGHVYRGSAIPGLSGRYFYGDYCGGWLRSFHHHDGVIGEHHLWFEGLGSIGSIGVDAAGELYVVALDGGAVYRLEPAG